MDIKTNLPHPPNHLVKSLEALVPCFFALDDIIALIFIRVHRSNDFNLFVESLDASVSWFFALDHINDSRWIPIHIRD